MGYSVTNPVSGSPVLFSDNLGSDAMRWFIYWETPTKLWAYGSDMDYFKSIDFSPGGAPTVKNVDKNVLLPKAVWEALPGSKQANYRHYP